MPSLNFQVPSRLSGQFEPLTVVPIVHPVEAVREAIAQGAAAGGYAVIVTDHTKQGDPVAYVNHAYEVLTGFKLAEIIGIHPHFLLTDDREQAGVKELEAAIHEGRACSAVLRDFRKNKVPIWYRVNISPILDASGKVTHFFGFLKDVTNQIESEQSEEEIDTFIGSLAHDLKTPLVGADRMFALIMEGEYGNIEPELQHSLMLLSKGNRQALNLVRNLLESFRLREGTLLHFELVDLTALINDAVQAVVAASDTTENQIEVLASSKIPHCILDRMAMSRMLTNLLDNAVKFSPRGAKIQISAEIIGSQIVIRITDNGIGIVAEETETIFNKCKRGRKQKYTSGCGLGLFICKEIVTAHHGRISLESTLGIGSTFTVELPVTPELATTAPEILI